MSGLSGGWLYLVERRDDASPLVTHARDDCRAVEVSELHPFLVPYGTRPDLGWECCEVCGGARPWRPETA
jgi:hypothetical protein